MSGLRLLNILEAVARASADRLHSTVAHLRTQAPGARMIGEFAVRTGVDRLRSRGAPPKNNGGRAAGSSGDSP